MIGIEVGDIDATTLGITVPVSVRNGGNAIAINVKIDAEIILKCSVIEANTSIPAYFQPISVPYMFNDMSHIENKVYFGPACLDALKQDIAMCSRRLELATYLMTNASKLSFKWTKGLITTKQRIALAWKFIILKLEGILRLQTSSFGGQRTWHHMETFAWDPEIQIIAYYRNHLNQYFKSSFRSFITMPSAHISCLTTASENTGATDVSSLCEDEYEKIVVLAPPPLHPQKYSVDVLSEEEAQEEIMMRDLTREIGGSCIPCVNTAPWLRS